MWILFAHNSYGIICHKCYYFLLNFYFVTVCVSLCSFIYNKELNKISWIPECINNSVLKPLDIFYVFFKWIPEYPKLWWQNLSVRINWARMGVGFYILFTVSANKTAHLNFAFLRKFSPLDKIYNAFLFTDGNKLLFDDC